MSTAVRALARPLVNLASNNYLGLRDHPRVREAAIRAIQELGVGSAAGRNAADRTRLHEQLERRLAEFKRVEAVVTFQSGYVANIGTIPALVARDDLVVYDELSHASTVDGARLSFAACLTYPHRDVGALERVLRGARRGMRGRPRYNEILVITDGVFGMDGEIAPLPEICAVAERHGASVMVDDAHGSGVLGRGGRGTVDHFGLHDRVRIQMGTLSKALGAAGGFVGCDGLTREHLLRRARPIAYSTLLPPAIAAASLAALEVLENEPERLERLWTNARHFRSGLQRLGFDTGASETPIVPILTRDPTVALQLVDRLADEGIAVQAIVPPTVAARRARVRTIVSSEHTHADLDHCLEVLARVARDVRIVASSKGKGRGP
ncbi:MAG TPA: aminotransferase class I/II-fold pyridoxal phosphate-dependent enzyme [Candidatus Limnocylindria bacterium]|nr:aminotransferase class I/II-fold pyridoxal phosphate-dependent enzyme [Candidatus Limnocylindria bacterium]